MGQIEMVGTSFYRAIVGKTVLMSSDLDSLITAMEYLSREK